MRIALFFLLASGPVWGQSVYLDQALRFGQMEFFPSATEEHAFYYLPDEIRLTHHPDGTPRFYFLKSADYRHLDSIRISRAPIGIVQMEVELAADRVALDLAWDSLKAANPKAVLKGPMVFDTCSFEIISATVADPRLTWQSTVAGAMLRVGDAVTVSLALHDIGAKIMWQSLQTETPDLSLVVKWAKHGLVSSGHKEAGADLKSAKPGSRTFWADWNVGRVNCPACFDASLPPIEEPYFRIREIYILNEQFGKGLDSTLAHVTVQMRKTHENGEQTLDEYRLDKLPALQDRLKYRLQYGWKSDKNGAKWLNYQYRIQWYFKNGATKETAWTNSNQPAIFLKVPTIN